MELLKPFNKKNFTKFAENLYHDDGEFEHYLPLCDGSLGRANGEVLHCALGELCEEFIGPVAKRATEVQLRKAISGEALRLKKGWINSPNRVVLFYTETTISDTLALNSTSKDMTLLKRMLAKIPNYNDSSSGATLDSQEDMIKRAKKTQKYLLKIANTCF